MRRIWPSYSASPTIISYIAMIPIAYASFSPSTAKTHRSLSLKRKGHIEITKMMGIKWSRSWKMNRVRLLTLLHPLTQCLKLTRMKAGNESMWDRLLGHLIQGRPPDLFNNPNNQMEGSETPNQEIFQRIMPLAAGLEHKIFKTMKIL
jgi:hypothetical protein